METNSEQPADDNTGDLSGGLFPMPLVDNPVAREVFADACDLPPAKREDILRERCAGNVELRRAVETLLRAHDQAGPFMGGGTREIHSDDSSMLGQRIGRYKLLLKIGEGGFGTVYLAEQEHPVRRRVALKIIKLGMDTRQVIARFEAERQALAIMDHPNIAKVLDAGATDAGRPYFVMELVRGVPITDYCDTNNLPVDERLALFVAVCQAVQHAHQKGIIHRDLKPNNVMIAMADGKPIPKVIDFGIAKATNQQLTEKTILTEFRQMIGTPQYMSPEQAEMAGIDIDTRSDVYSLGVMLYELLVGSTPFDPRDLLSKAYGEMQRMIREVDPPRPSTRLSTLHDTLATVAARRRIEPRKLGQILKGELDWIVMRALEKDRMRRYDSASSLAMDVQRYLDHEPVLARKTGAGYRLRKFVIRHKAGTAAGLAVAVALILGIAGTTGGMIRSLRAQRISDIATKDAIEQRNIAVKLLEDVRQAKIDAEKQAQRAKAANAFVRDMIASARPTTRPSTSELGATIGTDVKVADVLREAGAALDRLGGQPELELDSRLYLAKTFELLGDSATARVHYERAQALSRKLSGEDSEQTLQITVDLLLAEVNIEPKTNAGGQSVREDCEAAARQVSERAEHVFGPLHPLTFDARNDVAVALLTKNKLPEAESILRDLVSRAARNPAIYHPKGSARYLNNLSVVLTREGRSAEAEQVQHQALTLAATESQTDPRRSLVYRDRLMSSLYAQGKLNEASDALREAVAFSRTSLGPSHPQTLSRVANLSKIEDQLGNFDASALLLHELISLTANTEENKISLLQLHFAEAEARLRAGHLAEAGDAFSRVKSQWEILALESDKNVRECRFKWALVEEFMGLRIHQGWQGSAIQASVRLAVWDMLNRHNWGYPPPAVKWDALSFQLRPWTGQPAGTGNIDGGLDQLRAAHNPRSGVSFITFNVPRDGGAVPMRQGQWILVGPWDLQFFAVSGEEGNDETKWESVFAGTPLEKRRESSLNFVHLGGLSAGFGPHNRLDDFAMSATASLKLPPGKYRLAQWHDGGCRVYVDGDRIYDGWLKADDSRPLIEFSDQPRTIDVRWAGGGHKIYVTLEPVHPMADSMANDAEGWFYDAEVTLERLDFQAAHAPRDQSVHRERMNLLCRLGRFGDGEDELAKLIAIDPARALDWYRQAALLAYLDRREDYKRACRDMVEKFASSQDMSVLERIALTAMLFPSDKGGFDDLNTLGPMVDKPVAAGGRFIGWCQLAKSLHEFRLGPGHYADATQWADKALGTLPATGYGRSSAYLIRAMAILKDGHRDEANEAYKMAEQNLKMDATPGKDDLSPVGLENYLICHALWREAKVLFADPAATQP